MREFDDYKNSYKTLTMERDADGILLLTAHTDGGPLRWGALPHEEWPHAFHDIAMDRKNRVIILTGTGDEFSGPRPPAATRYARPVADMDRIVFDGRHLLANLLEIQAPIISAINGPCIRHSEIPLLSDIVLASDTTVIEDAGHFESGLVPGDGVNLIYPMLMGHNRARYFLMTSQKLSAQQAQDWGLVNEVLPKDQLMDRAWEWARELARHNDMHLRNTRQIMTLEFRKKIFDHLGYTLQMEAMANLGRDKAPE
ncbi:enoyl-CoA hydratase/isomerase family protein [Pseudoprimorskyibacter insulae]|uniref:6-oxocamphor hydrolase n=1 Tax=Pseudoprimorskyibacter insulae TaxID=1695997 RepID=A0A2R8AQ08_9RHOB|nr:enoyl-CoA hydratase/isomerase family protein [Pseudoprimorskyibacter insulae]SPF78168.1 6-oxocamphor hydrolase [Pseudoprimorskyibacter insulae]